MFRVAPTTLQNCEWTKARASVGMNACVEFTADAAPGTSPRMLCMRDSKWPAQFALRSADVAALIEAARTGRLDIA